MTIDQEKEKEPSILGPIVPFDPVLEARIKQEDLEGCCENPQEPEVDSFVQYPDLPALDISPQFWDSLEYYQANQFHFDLEEENTY